MKKGWKIALVSLGSVVGLVAVVVMVACWLLFTPARLTAIVNKLAGQYILCENHFERVDLTLFKTFPNAGLDIQEVYLVNPMPGAPNDTVAHIGSLTVGIDVKAFWDDGSIIVRQLRIDNAYANLFTDAEGRSNLDIFPPSADTTESEPFDLPEHIDLQKIALNNFSADYADLQQGMKGHVDRLDLSLKGKIDQSKVDAALAIDLPAASVSMTDSRGNETVCASLGQLVLKLDGQGTMDDMQGCLKLDLPTADIALSGTPYTTKAMRKHDLLSVKMPFSANLNQMNFSLKEAVFELLENELELAGDVNLGNETAPMRVNLSFNAERWPVGELLEQMPALVSDYVKGMDLDARLSLSGMAVGNVQGEELPKVNAHVVLEKGRFAAPDLLPVKLRKVDADLMVDLNLSTDSVHQAPSTVDIQRLNVATGQTTLAITGKVDDLMGKMFVDAVVKGDVNLPDVRPFLSDTMPVALDGKVKLNAKAKGLVDDFSDMALQRVRVDGTLKCSNLEIEYDSIYAQSPHLDVALRIPAAAGKVKPDEVIGVHIASGQLAVQMPDMNLAAKLADPDIRVALPNILEDGTAISASFRVGASHVNAALDSIGLTLDTLHLKGSVRNDTMQQNVLKQWNPVADIAFNHATVALPELPEAVRVTAFDASYRPESLDIAEATILWGLSDYHLSGQVSGLEDWLDHKDMLRGKIDFVSNYTDVDQLLSMLSGMGSDADTLAAQREEDNVPAEANPFIVPKDVNIALHTNIKRCVAFGNDLDNLGGDITVNDGVAVLDQIGFVCKAARMQLTAVYKSPRVNHLFVGLDFHLLDIQIDELLDMIPSIDTLVPMLSAFNGNANFHLAAECNLDAFYQPKMSTLIGAAAISGRDLVVLNDTSIANIARLLQFKDWKQKDAQIGIDSLDVELTAFRKEIKVYPFLLNVGRYQLCAGGSHMLDNRCNYHLELIKCPLPVRLAVDVKGTLDKPQISLGSVRYAELYKPEKQNAVQARTLEIKKLVRQALEANVKITR